MRGDTCKKQISLIFTGDEFREGLKTVTDILEAQEVPGSFFLTGRFLEQKEARKMIRKINKAGHYIGPHSDAHLLYMPWEDREKMLVNQEQFDEDLRQNMGKLRRLGITGMDKFVAPYEWYNREIVRWTEELGLALYNFTPGLRTAADYTYPEMGRRYMSSKAIMDQLIMQEQQEGLNGYIILVHLGTDERRTDKFFDQLDDMIDVLKDKKYKFVTLDDI